MYNKINIFAIFRALQAETSHKRKTAIMVCGVQTASIGVCDVFTKSIGTLILSGREDSIGVIIEAPKNNMMG